MNPLNKKRGQSLIEVLIAVTVGALIVGSAAAALIFTVRSNQQNRTTDAASSLAQELLDNVRSVSEGKWQSVNDVASKGPSTTYHLALYKQLQGTVSVTNGSTLVTGTGTNFTATGTDNLVNLVISDNIIINSLPFTVAANVNSDTSLTLNIAYSGATADGLNIFRDFSVRSGTEPPITSNNISLTRSFAVENVNRDNCGTKDITSASPSSCSGDDMVGILDDPSTQKVTAKVTWPQGGDTAEVSVSEHLTRSKNEINQFTDWSGSSGVGGPVTKPTKDYSIQSGLDTTTNAGSLKLALASGWLISSTFDTEQTAGAAFNSIMWKGSLGTVGNTVKFQFASSNQATGDSPGEATGPIDSVYRYAWNDIIGWLDFYGAPGGPAAVTTAKMTRWATSSNGEFALDCATTPNGDVCAASNFYVSNNNGNLAGWAWNDVIGWVSFCGNAAGGSTWNGSTWVCPASPTYQVTIDAAIGDFAGWAWNDVIGWVSFCGNAAGGSTWNGSTWVCPASPTYKVRVAGVGPWAYIGPNGTSSSFYVSPTDIGLGKPLPIVTAHHNNKRYYRYKVYMAGDTSLVVDDVIINWSP